MHTLEELRAGRLAGIKRLQLSCGLTEFPPEIYFLADSLEILDLSDNALTSLPDDLTRLHKLRIVFCSNNPFTELPAVLGRCPELTMIGFKACRVRHVPAESLPAKLRWLVLTDNQVESLPEEIGSRPLQKFMLAGNRLRTLPASLAGCRTLELFRIAANQFEAVPEWVADLPRLSWFACAGNPFEVAAKAAAAPAPAPALAAGVPRGADTAAAGPAKPAADACPDVPWPALKLGRKLGEGASGLIYQATLDGEQVAVKLFKGAMTSDGLPDSEMDACIAAGSHPNLIPVLGRVTGHPDGTHGLVLKLIDPDYRNLAGPPSLDSCTRDIYPADKRFTPSAALSIARGVASAARHLHARGILHGDLYAHNILHCPQGRPLLGDFGGASFYDPAGSDAGWLQRQEVRAFGCLLEELAERIDAAPTAPAAPAAPAASDAQRAAPQAGDAIAAPAEVADLLALAAECLGPIAARPLFVEIEQRLR